MSNGIDWFRWHHGSVTDNKFPLVANKAGVRLGDVIVVWTFLLEKASSNAVRGEFGKIDHEALDFMIGAGEGASARIIQALTDRGLLVGSRIEAWERRQPKRERENDKSTDRVRELRARRAEDQCTLPLETPCNATERQETPREEKSREDINTPIPPKGGEKSRKREKAVPIQVFLDECKERTENAILDGDPILHYADKAGIPDDFLVLHWDFFRAHYSEPDAKKYKDWRAVYRRSVKGNWFNLWYFDKATKQCNLSSKGIQAKNFHEGKT